MSRVLLILLTCSSLSILHQVSNCDHQQDKFIYNGFDDDLNPNITLTHAAKLRNRTIQLTSFPAITGHVFHSTPFQFKNSTNGTVSSFSTCFAFHIVPSLLFFFNTGGLTFTIAPSRDFSTAQGGDYLGLLNSSNNGNITNHLFAVELDTFQNVDFNDIDDNHVGIDTNSLFSLQSTSAGYIDSSDMYHLLSLMSGYPIYVWIEFDPVASVLNVTLSPDSSKSTVPLLSLGIDLSQVLLESMYVGITASTGQMGNAEYLLGWSFQMYGGATLDLDYHAVPPRNKQTGLIVSISVAAFITLLASLFTVVYFVRRKKNGESVESWEREMGPCRYKYIELKKATKSFSSTELLGRGGFGQVYRGKLPGTNMNVAVKRISHESKQGVREFVSEISTIGKLRHRNLVQLLGWCRRGADLLLVYELMPNGSLDKLLFKQPSSAFSWEHRFGIIKGVASGLLYLHEGYEKVVIHRDVKSSNVLLDGEMNAKLGDFGLAELHDHGSNPDTTRVVGTIGYMAPELMRTGRATTSSDVFAFGILLLEVACGRKSIDSTVRAEELVLVDFVWRKYEEERLLDVVDDTIEGEFDEKEVLMVLKLGLMCSSNEQSGRPNMRHVVRYLEGEAEMPAVLSEPGASMEEVSPKCYLHKPASFTALPDSLVRSMQEPR